MVFSLRFLLLLRLLLCGSCFANLLPLRVINVNILMATSGSPAMPGRRAPLR